MQTTVTFKRLDSSDALKSYVEKKVARFDKMLDSPAEANVVLSVEKIRHLAEITLTCDKLRIHAKEESESMYASIDTLMDKVRAQIKKNKDKLKRHLAKNKKSIKNEDMMLEEPPMAEAAPAVASAPASPAANDEIVVEALDFKPIDVDDAVLELKSGSDNFLVFNNSQSERVNVLYRRSDGNLGLIQPSN